MIWLLLKITVFLGIVVAAAWGAGYLLETDGGVRVSVADTEFTLGALESVIALLFLVAAIWVFLRLASLIVAFIRFLNGDETAMTRYFARNRERKGYDALAEGMMALASGEGQLAMAKAARADRYLNRPDLTTLLTAQAAEQAGDRRKAEEAYKRLLSDDKTRFVGVRGLMKQKIEDGDTDKAMKLAEKAFALKPKHEDTQNILLQLQADSHDWSSARRTLGAKLKHGQLPRDVHKRRDAVLALGEAKDILDDDKPIEAREAAIAANRKSPDLIPAAVMASDSYVAQDKPKYATRVIRKAWEGEPHPDLAAAFARIQPNETPAERVRRFGVLLNAHKDHPETRMLNAELQIAAEDFPAAKKALGDLAETDPTARSLTIMAAIERGSGADDAVVKGWLARALTAPRGPQWVCDSCEKAHSEWAPVCDSCGGFDTMTWRRPKADSAQMPTGAEMLPLIVGQIEDQSEAPAEEAEILEPAESVSDPTEATEDDATFEVPLPETPPADYVAEAENTDEAPKTEKKEAS
ncbi:MAG: heme biosynthesis HemY N-terminal domain-containing protein [Paracoccaceae bacterium]|nr:heme biosynthesis HemY N-terminal domain-containing protein [Paracoccaceae bacterium]